MRHPGLVAIALLVAGCGSLDGGGELEPRASAVRVAGGASFAAGCEGPGQRGTRYPGSQVEPWLAANPRAAGHLVAVWQQDRWSNGGASGLASAVSRDGGRTWRRGAAPFSRCTGGTSLGGDYERASDPWVTFAADGTAWQAGLALDTTTAAKAVLVSRSTDGGETWAAPQTLARDADADVFLDKETITADPVDARYVYAVWDRLENLTAPDQTTVRGPAWFTRTTDGGATWEAPRAIFDPGPDAQTIGHQIVALPDGTLVDVFVVLLQVSAPSSPMTIDVLRSTDRGATWSAPVTVASLTAAGTSDRYTKRDVRSGTVVPAVAADPRTGALYVAWQDARFSGGAQDAVVLATSADGGRSWSAPRQASVAGGPPAFRPALAVAPDGTLALTYYDFRFGPAAIALPLPVTGWLATSTDGGQSWREVALGGSFDFRLAPDAEGWFLGDYTGLVHDGAGFVAAYESTVDGGAGVYAARWPDGP